MTAEQLDNRDFFQMALLGGRFEMLNLTTRIVLAFSYLVETEYTTEKIGRLFDPPKTGARISGIRNGAYRLLSRKPFKIDSLLLPEKAKRSILRKFGDISPEELAQVPEKELLRFTSGFGVGSLQELKEKLASYQPQQT